jgi:Mg2+ and Co2+ transporter CorA
VFRDVFGFAPEAIEECSHLSLVPKLKRYSDHIALTIHSLDSDGHLLELDEFIGPNYLVTVHAAAFGVADESVFKELDAVLNGIRRGSYHPASAVDLAAELIGEIAAWLERFLEEIAMRAGGLDRRMREGQAGDRQQFLEELTEVRHDLLTIYNRASQTTEAARRVAVEAEPVLGPGVAAFDQLASRFESLRKLCENEREFANGVLEHYQSVVQTKMNVAMERLALIAYLLIPFTIATGLLGMQISARDGLNPIALAITLIAVVGATWLVYRFTKRRGWW